MCCNLIFGFFYGEDFFSCLSFFSSHCTIVFFPVMGWAGPWLNIFIYSLLFYTAVCDNLCLLYKPTFIGVAITLVCNS